MEIKSLLPKVLSRRLDQRFIFFCIYLSNFVTSVMMNEPRFAQPIPNVTVAVGRDASLPCVVEHLGGYKVAWIHIDRQMILTIHRHVISRIPRYSITYDNANTWLLHVNQAHQDDRGYYMCQVNTNPMISQVGYLQVVVPPNILDIESTPSSVAVRENQNINMTCRADGFPAPKIIWRREDGEEIVVEKKKKVLVYDGEVLPLSKVSRNEMGAYLCIATNGVPPSVSKRIILDVEFSPMIWVPNQLVGAPAGTDVSIDCHTEAHPKAIIYWVFNSVMVLPSKKYKTDYTENSYRAHMKLTIRNLQYGDFGNYRCISKNSLGETEGSIRVYDIPLPSTPSKQVTHSNTEHRNGSTGSSNNNSNNNNNNNNINGSGGNSNSGTGATTSTSNQATKHNGTEGAQSETNAMKPDIFGNMASPPTYSSASSASSGGSQSGGAGGTFVNLGANAGNTLLNIVDTSKHIERKASLAIGKTVFHTEHPPSDLTAGSLAGTKILCTTISNHLIFSIFCTYLAFYLSHRT